jgi:hypothetical protein
MALLCVGATGAAAQGQTGLIHAVCQVAGVASPLQLQFTRYRDGVVWMDRHGLNSTVTDMQQWGTTYWEGAIDTPYGRYTLTGENNFIEAWPVGGVYSDMVTLQLTVTGPNTFSFRDFYNGGPPIPCRIRQS